MREVHSLPDRRLCVDWEQELVCVEETLVTGLDSIAKPGATQNREGWSPITKTEGFADSGSVLLDNCTIA
jgi:hypothetical protein